MPVLGHDAFLRFIAKAFAAQYINYRKVFDSAMEQLESFITMNVSNNQVHKSR
jgi:hypothetical protein